MNTEAMERKKTEDLLTRNSSALTQQWLETLNTLRNNQQGFQISRSPIHNMYSTQQSLINKQKFLLRDSSFQSDDSHCSSVESVLELRRPDPEEVLLGLGFGPRNNASNVNRIPHRFLQQSQLIPNIDINKFIDDFNNDFPTSSRSLPASPAKIRPRSC